MKKEPIMKGNQKYVTTIILLLCFLTPALVLLFAFSAYGMAPFGEKSIMIMDMSGQYSEFYIGLRHFGKMGNMFFSWSKTLGTSYIGVFAYYLSSPLSFLTLLSSEANMPIFLLFLTVLKIGLCGMTFGIYLMYMFKRRDFSVVLFSLFYGLMSYNIVYSMCLMWIDGVIWLPIILIGIEELLKKGKRKLLATSLFCVFISTYYISYMIGAFSCIYLVYRYLSHYSDEMPVKRLIIYFTKLISSALIAALLGAWFLIPTLVSLFDGKIGGANYTPQGNINFELKNLVSKLFLGSYDSITNSGMPFIYCGIVVTILFIGYFFIRSVSVKEKASTFLVASYLLASMYFINLDVAWHIFQFPNWFPYRYSFVFLFFMIFTAYKAFDSIKDLSKAFFVTFPLVSIMVAQLVLKIRYRYLDEERITLTVKLLVFYIFCLLAINLIKHVKEKEGFDDSVKRYAIAFLTLTMLVISSYELYKHSIYMLKGLDKAHHYEDIKPYQEYRNAVNKLLEEAKSQKGKHDFYRVTKNFSRSINEPISFGYSGIDHYSSAYNRVVNDTLRTLGFSSAYLWITGYGSTIVTDTILNIEYLMSISPVTKRYEKLKTIENISLYRKPEDRNIYGEPKDLSIYRNPIALPVAFMADSELLRKKLKAPNMFAAQNLFLSHLVGENINCFERITPERYGKYSYPKEDDDYVYMKSGSEGIVSYYFIAEKDMELYAYFPFNNNHTNCSVYVNDVYVANLYYGQYDCAHFLGSFKKGDEARIDLIFKSTYLNTRGNMFYALDYDKFASICDEFREESLKVDYFDGNEIKGTVSAKDNGTLFTSIPYDKGWSVYVDGKKVKTHKYSDTFLCIEVPKGEHEIIFKFTHVGFVPGLILSITTLLGIITFEILQRRKLISKS